MTENTVRCAIYTRKSSEDGLEQDFNSLHAQREACAAYVLSQASEGWSQLADEYDDGGISGGTLERPALTRLLADIAAGKIDIVVVYKVDRLTRSLIDFAKLVEAFDAAGTSFVSITQSFNTTTSMGRLTLNMLLSFAQFEREVTAERIRDKLAASKAKGMWMGGVPPLGYKPAGRSLAIAEKDAQVVRDIYARYHTLGNVRLVAQQLKAQGIKVPNRKSGTGRALGGGSFSRGQINAILTNPVYAGDIGHKGTVYPGLHEPIIDRVTWDAVQQQIAGNRQGAREQQPSANTSPLAGKIVDAQGEPLLAVHSTKATTPKNEGSAERGSRRRYRYYVSKALQHGTRQDTQEGLRLPATEVETVIAGVIAGELDDPLGFAQRMRLMVEPSDLKVLNARCGDIAAKLRAGEFGIVGDLLSLVRIDTRHLEIILDVTAAGTALGMPLAPDAAPTVS
ncbi:MAG: recombinase family protein, partial [Burkholderiales bacterium]